jgi:hypothetical protein
VRWICAVDVRRRGWWRICVVCAVDLRGRCAQARLANLRRLCRRSATSMPAAEMRVEFASS